MPLSSPPTDRVIDVIELLARADAAPMRTADVARVLATTPNTARAIVDALSARGWVRIDPVDKTLTLGRALDDVATEANLARIQVRAASDAAAAIGAELHMATSVTERSGDWLVRTGSDGAVDRMAFAAPFGSVFAAWEDLDGQDAWIARGGFGNSEAGSLLLAALNDVRQLGYAVERMSPATAPAADLLRVIEDDTIAERLADLAAAGVRAAYPEDDRPVTEIGAAVHDRHGRVRISVAVHPRAPLRRHEVSVYALHVVDAARDLTQRQVRP